MKKTFLLLIVLCITALAVLSCKKDKKEVLPPETQTGARTFGCLIDGEVFIPGGAQLSGGSLNSNYQEIDGDHYFRLVGNNERDKKNRRSIGIFSYKSTISNRATFVLENRFSENKFYALCSRSSNTPFSGKYFETDSIYRGELFITYLDTVQQIVSGTFWFDAISENGEVVQVRSGRFDMRYTR